jgi:hypothetical protein
MNGNRNVPALLALILVCALMLAPAPAKASNRPRYDYPSNRLVLFDAIVTCQHVCILDVNKAGKLVVADLVKGGWVRWDIAGQEQTVTTNPVIINK